MAIPHLPRARCQHQAGGGNVFTVDLQCAVSWPISRNGERWVEAGHRLRWRGNSFRREQVALLWPWQPPPSATRAQQTRAGPVTSVLAWPMQLAALIWRLPIDLTVENTHRIFFFIRALL